MNKSPVTKAETYLHTRSKQAQKRNCFETELHTFQLQSLADCQETQWRLWSGKREYPITANSVASQLVANDTKP